MLSKLNKYIKVFPARINIINKIANDPILGRTYCTDFPQKNKYRIFLEMFWWLLRYQEVNKFYRSYELDCKKNNINDYISCGEFQKKRDMAQELRYLSLGETSYCCVLRDKFLFGKYLESLSVPSPRIYALGHFGCITLSENNCTIEIKDILSCEFDGFVKPLHGYGGSQIMQLKIENGKAISGKLELTLEQLLMQLPEVFMIQERFKQHYHLNMLFPESVNTLRLVTYLENNKAKLFDGFLRAGVGSLCCDNWAAGGILGGIDMSTGRAAKFWKYKPGFGTTASVHPDTKFILGDLEFPWFEQSCDMVREIHEKYFYGFHSIGWDVAAGPEGPSIIEGNESWSIEGFQTPYGGQRASIENIFKI